MSNLPCESGDRIIPVLDHGYIKPIHYWGSDETIIEAARMSTAKGFVSWDKDMNLLTYLYVNKHHTPFEQCGASFEIQAPIFVFREWHRHRTQSYNEMSGRYTVLPNLYYIPSIERLVHSKQHPKNKQSSAEGLSLDQAKDIQLVIENATLTARQAYDKLISAGLAREVARIILPVNQYSRMRASANLRNWLHFLALRLDKSAQWEIRQYAHVIRDLLSERFPRTLDLFDRFPEELEDTRDRKPLAAGGV